MQRMPIQRIEQHIPYFRGLLVDPEVPFHRSFLGTLASLSHLGNLFVRLFPKIKQNPNSVKAHRYDLIGNVLSDYFPVLFLYLYYAFCIFLVTNGLISCYVFLLLFWLKHLTASPLTP